MSWSANTDALAAALVDPSVFGEPVTLPSGETVMGVFTVTPPPGAPWQEIGAALHLTAHTNPEVYLLADAAAGLQVNDALLIEAQRYLVVESHPPTAGMVRVILLPAPTDALRPSPANRWQ